MNLSDSMRLQNNINKVVSQEIEYDLLPMDSDRYIRSQIRWTNYVE